MITVQVNNLGILKQAEFSLGELTILCGGNNTGKTYATYALFGFLSRWRDAISIHVEEAVVKQLLTAGTVNIDITPYKKNAAKILAEGCQAYTKQLPAVFAAPSVRFKDTTFQVTLDSTGIRPGPYEQRISSTDAELFSITKPKGSAELVVSLLTTKRKVKIPKEIVTKFIGDALQDILFGHHFPSPFIASAERTGAAIFRKELNFARNRLLEEIGRTNQNINPRTLPFKVDQDYALPVKTNVDFTRQLETEMGKSSFLADQHPEVLDDFADIIEGEYLVTANDELYYVPKGKRVKLTLGESSSAVRSLFEVGFYLKHLAKPGDLLLLDEPELNLHPENQRRMARLFARLVNLGIKVFITTHSDYLIKELNTLIMLNHDKPHLKRIAEVDGYLAAQLLSSDKVKVYIAEQVPVKSAGRNQRKTSCQTFTPADISPELGIEARSFDTTIDTMNRIQEEIVWGEE